MITKYSLKKPMTVFVAVVLTLILGAVAFVNIKTDLLPNIEMPYVMVMTVCPGYAPEKVEAEVTKPLESSLSTVGGVEKISSTSSENMSMLAIEFSYNSNMDRAMIELNNSLSAVSAAFDKEVGAPFMMQIDPDMMPVYIASVSKKGADFEQLSRITEDIVVPALERTDGVASVMPLGTLVNTVEVTLNQDKIDSVNEKIADAFDRKSADAFKEINKGKKALSKAKDEMRSQKQDASKKMAQAGIAMADGKAFIIAGLSAMEASEAQLKQVLDMAGKIVPKFTPVKDPEKIDAGADKAASLLLTLSAQIKKSGEALGELASGLEKSDPDAIGWDDLEEMLKGDPDAYATAEKIRAYLSGVLGPDGSLTLKLKELSLKMNESSGDMQALAEKLKGMEPAAAWNTLSGYLTKFMDSIRESADAIPKQKEMLKQKLNELSGQQVKLEQGKIILATELASAQQKIESSEEKLNEGEAKLKETLDKAAENAGLSSLLNQKTLGAIITAQNISMPAGYLNEGGKKFSVKVGDALKSIDELKNLPLFVSSEEEIGTVTLLDVADIAIKDKNENRFAKVNGLDGILLTLQKQSLSSTNIVSKAVRGTIADLKKEYPGLEINAMMDQGVYIDIVIESVLKSLISGGILAALILFVFLKSVRATFVVAFSIPISLMLAVVLMYFSGVTVNLISMAGLALGVGMLVDNSIVVIENTYRLRSMGVPAGKAALTGARQMAGAITASTLTTVCVFLPIVFTKGISRQLFADMGLAVGYSLLASLLVALSLVPVLSATMLRDLKVRPEGERSRVKDIYGKMLGFCLDRKWLPIGLSLIMLALAVYGGTKLGTAFIPESSADQMMMTISLPEDEEVTDEKLHERTLAVTDALLTIKDVDAIGVYDMPERSMMSSGPKKSLMIYIVLKEDKSESTRKVTEAIRKKAAAVPGCKTALARGANITAFMSKGVEIKIRGEKIEILKELAEKTTDLLKVNGGLENIDGGFGNTSPEIHISVDKEKAMEHQVTVGQVLAQVAEAIQDSVKSTSLDTAQQDMDVMLCKSEDGRLTFESLKDYPLSCKDMVTGEVKSVLLGEISDISMSENLTSVFREDLKRVVSVKARVKEGYNIGLISRSLTNELKKIDVPSGYSIRIEGENKMINQTLHDLGLMLILAVVMIYLIMVAQFQSLTGPFVVMFTIPLAFTGGLLALWIFGLELSVISGVGFLILAGVVVNNGIVFVDTSNQLQKSGIPRREALIETGKMRMRPIFMTAITTVLGLTALVLGIGTGADMVQPLAIVVVSGLSYATLLTLFVVPALCDGILMRRPMEEIKI